MSLEQCKMQYATLLDMNGHFDEAAQVYFTIGHTEAVRRLIFLYSKTGRHQEALTLGQKLREVEGYPYQEYLSHLNLGDFQTAWQQFKETQLFEELQKIHTPKENVNNFGLVVEGGVGDEIRLASVYDDIIASNESVTITCDPRLLTLFSRSFDAVFIPSTRFYNSDGTPRKNQALGLHLNDFAAEYFKRMDRIETNLSVLAEFRPNRESFKSRTYLKPLYSLREKWAYNLKQISSKPKIGVCRGSTWTSTTKEVSKIGFEHWKPIFDIKKYDFINLQLDFNEKDAQIIQSHEARNFYMLDVDLKDNFEEAVALYSQLDYVIAPPNYACDLAAACGTKVLTFVNSRHHDWRFRDGKDIWCNTTKSFQGIDKSDTIKQIATWLLND
jgi:hypothetical protein